MQRLMQLKERFRLIQDVRGMGLLVALVLRRHDGSAAQSEAEQIMYSALSKGLSFKTSSGSTLVLTPPLNIAEEDLNRAAEILEQCFQEVATQQ